MMRQRSNQNTVDGMAKRHLDQVASNDEVQLNKAASNKQEASKSLVQIRK